MSTAQFRERIRQSIADETLQTALDNNTERRLKGRALAFESIPDWRQRRQRAHAIRADVIDHLEDYLTQFIKKNEENGVIVHCVKDAAEAIQITLNVARQTSARLIAKSKSMVSEEINLNHALEAEGIEVVETDLGEYIVQLRHEKPSHIITPAAHLRKEQVGELFHEKLGIPYTTDIPTLTATARKVLREVFLTADIGLSGVNFGVAETGSICIITNEGNGRMVTTIPPVHVALMGMERIVPNLDDLALMLSLLPRSATGQKLTVYTQLLHQPLAGQTRHLIILDNGRMRVSRSPLKESLYCIRCGACLNACPVFRELSGHAYIGNDGSIAPYPGPIGSIVSPGLLGENFVQLAQASSLCGACKDACPVDIDLPKMLTRVRAGQVSSNQLSVSGAGAGLSSSTKFILRMYSRIARSRFLFTVSQKFAALGSFLLAPSSPWIRLPAITGWGYSKDFPRFAGRTFRDGFSHRDTHPPRVQVPGESTEKFEKKKEDSSVASLPQNDMNRVEQFTKELTALSGAVYQAVNVTEEIIEFLKSRDIHKIHLEPNTLDESLLQKAAIEFSHEPDPEIRVGLTPHVFSKFSEMCGVTKAICGLADTGSVLQPVARLAPSGDPHRGVEKIQHPAIPSRGDASAQRQTRRDVYHWSLAYCRYRNDSDHWRAWTQGNRGIPGMKFIASQKQLAIYLSLLAIVGMMLVYLVTHRFGPGISTDGARYLSTAQSLIEGRGFYDYLNLPLTQFPPLYSILIAALSLITKLDVFVAVQYLNILTFGLVIWLAGYFFYRTFPNERVFAYVGSTIFATSLSLIVMASNILSDLLFLAFTVGFLITATQVMETESWKSIFIMGMIASVSTFQRYAGLVLIFTGAFLILFLFRRNLAKGVLSAGIFGAITGLPILLWVFLHNYLCTGILFGVRLPPVYFGNLQVTIEKAEHWFLPSMLTDLIPAWVIALLVLVVLVIGNRLADWKRWAHHLTDSQFLPSLVFFVLYLGVLVFNVSYWEVRYPYMDRIHIIILPALLALVFLTIRELMPSYLRKLNTRQLQVFSILVLLIWLSFPIYNVQKYVRRGFYEGDSSEFNMYNIPVLRNSGIKEYLWSQAGTDDQKMYSNYEAAAWFMTRHIITKLPFGDVEQKQVNAEEVLQKFPDWPGEDGKGYVIWIKALSFKPYVLQPAQLTERADFQLLYSSKGGNIYLLTPK